jgi:hypothetical protein
MRAGVLIVDTGAVATDKVRIKLACIQRDNMQFRRRTDEILHFGEIFLDIFALVIILCLMPRRCRR